MAVRILELFGGVGACSRALERLSVVFEVVDYVENNKFAVKSFNAIHSTNFEPQDIREWDKDIEVDLVMHGSPCQDFSVAGKQAGGDKGSGTRSSLMYETLRIVEKLRPRYVIWENVKNVLSARHRHNFDTYLKTLEELGYANFYQVLNAKDYGVPQNRERVFTVSILRTVAEPNPVFVFPEKRPLCRRLKDVLESDAKDKYYLSDAQAAKLINSSYDQNKRFYPEDGLSPTLNTMSGGWRQPKILQRSRGKNAGGMHDESPTISSSDWEHNNVLLEPFIAASRGRSPESPSDKATGSPTEQRLEPKFDGTTNTITSVQKDNYVVVKTANSVGYDVAHSDDGIDLSYPSSKTRRGRVGHGISKTIETGSNMGVLDGARIRRLTPKECWRLMGFDDDDFEKAAGVCSNTQLYKQAGNSIVVNVLEAILKTLLMGGAA